MNKQTHFRTCTLCEAMCGVAIEHEDGKILSIKGDKNDPFSKGHICPKATALQDIYNDPDRLKHPMRRTADGWERIGWDEAYKEVASNIKRIQSEHGDNAVGIYLGNPNVHNLGSMLVGPTLTRALRTTNRFTATSADQLPSHFASRHMFGHMFMIPIPDVDRTDFFLILGANPLVSNGSLMSAGGIEPRMKTLQKRGGKIVVIDPRRTQTAKMADQHLAIKPGQDVLLLLALVHTVLTEKLGYTGKLKEYLNGLDELKGLVGEFSAETVAPHINIPAAQIKQLARDFSGARRAVAYGRMGISTQKFGGLCNWLINVLNIVTGNFDRAGGAMFTKPAIDTLAGGSGGKFGRFHSRVSQRPEQFGELPCSVMAEEILTEGEGQIKAMVTVAGNPILSTPNGGQLDKAFEQLDFMVSIDIYINETSRHANIILPSTTSLETSHYDISFNTLAVRNVAKFSPQLFEPVDDARHDYQIYRELAQELAIDDRSYDQKRNAATLEQMLDKGLRKGPYELTLDELKTHPHGMDLGALEPCLPERLFSADKKIHLTPPEIISDLPRAHALLTQSDPTEFDLLLIGRRELRTNNSWMHNSERLVRGKNRCTVMIHPDDAAERQLEAAQTVQVASRVGSVELPLEITDDVMVGVVSIPHGYGHSRDGIQMAVAEKHAGVNINDLTDETFFDTLTGNAAFSGVPVKILELAHPEPAEG